ncbi:MAG: DNA-directed RNA polymerase subunit alpha C-terminal domain-containing protein [Planctomycetaceae bacterium]
MASSTASMADVRECVLGTGPFGPAEVDRLADALGRDASVFRQLRSAVRECEETGERSPAAAVRLGVCQYLLGRLPQAVETLKAADGGAMAHFYLGLALVGLAHRDHRIDATSSIEMVHKAQEAFSAAAKAGYDAVSCRTKEAGCFRLAGEIAKADAALASVADAAVASADYWCEMGSLAKEKGDLCAASQHFERSLAVDAGHSESLFSLGVLNDQAGNDKEARSLFERSLERYPQRVGALVNLGLLYEDIDAFDKAQHCYERVLEAFPENARARLFLKDSTASGDLQTSENQQRQRDRLEQVLSLPVSDFELSVRSRNCLAKMGIQTLGDLARTTERSILESKNFGETSLVEIKEMLATKGLTLGQLAPQLGEDEVATDGQETVLEQQEIHGLSLDELSLSVRARKCMTKLAISTIGELVRRTAEDLMECKNFGVTSLNEVRERLADRGLRLRGE